MQRVREHVRGDLSLANVELRVGEQRLEPRAGRLQVAAIDLDAGERKRRDRMARLELQRLGRQRGRGVRLAGACFHEREVRARVGIVRREFGRAPERGTRIGGPAFARARGGQRVPGLDAVGRQGRRARQRVDSLGAAVLGQQQSPDVDHGGCVSWCEFERAIQQLARHVETSGLAQGLCTDPQQDRVREPLLCGRLRIADRRGQVTVGACPRGLGHQRQQPARAFVVHQGGNGAGAALESSKTGRGL